MAERHHINKAVVASKGEYLVFLDGDCIPDNNFVKDHYSLRQHGTVIGGRRVQLPQKLSDMLTPELVANGFLKRKTLYLLFCKERHSENVLRVPLRIRNILGICKPKKEVC